MAAVARASEWRVQKVPPAFHDDGTDDGDGDALAGISCASNTECMATGFGHNNAMAIRMHRGHWSLSSAPVPSMLSGDLYPGGVSCSSPRFCEMVGANDAPDNGLVPLQPAYAEGWNGSRWSQQPVPIPTSVFNTFMETNGVSCVSSRSCIAVGSDWLGGESSSFVVVWQWNGVRWTMVPVALPKRDDADLYGVSCSSPDACTAVGQFSPGGHGNYRPLVERWDGHRWSMQKTPNPRTRRDTYFYGVSCSSRRACIAVGVRFGVRSGAAFTEEWDGKRWAILPTPTFRRNYLSSVSCVSADDCVAVGTGIEEGAPEDLGGGQAPVAERWHGKRWSVQHPPKPVRSPWSVWLAGVSCPSRTTCYAVGMWQEPGYLNISHAYVERWTEPKKR